MDLFKNRRLLIATKHGKEKVIAPIMEKALGVQCIIASSYDTDQLGTFTGEVERTLTPVESLRKKCQEAMDLYNIDLGIANEGSFGAHPAFYFVPADEELMILIDRKNNLEIIVKHIVTNTNFAGEAVSTWEDLTSFTQKVGFPEHALILRKEKDSKEAIFKNIKDQQTLKKYFNQLIQDYGQAFAETDMRAMNNPTRMQVIKETTEKLIKTIQSSCPNCNCPGFTIKEYKEGLPCEWCNRPTKSILSVLYECKKCMHQKEEWYPKKKQKEDPQYCDYCNP